MARKKNAVLVPDTAQMNLENTVLRERSQRQKVTYRMIPFTCDVRGRQIHRNRNEQVVAKGLHVEGWSQGRSGGNGYRFLFGVMEIF